MQSKNEWGRRGFLIGAGTLAAAPLMGTPSVQAQGPSTNVSSRTVSRVAGRRSWARWRSPASGSASRT